MTSAPASTRDRRSIARDGTPLFSARAVSRGNAVKGVSFDVFPGEVFALGGLVGSGRTEVARLALGVDRLEGGHFELDGKRIDVADEAEAVAKGIALVPGGAAGAGPDARPVGRLQHQRRLAHAAALDPRPAVLSRPASRAAAPSG